MNKREEILKELEATSKVRILSHEETYEAVTEFNTAMEKVAREHFIEQAKAIESAKKMLVG